MDVIWRALTSVAGVWFMAGFVLIVLIILTVRVWLSARRLDMLVEEVETIDTGLATLVAHAERDHNMHASRHFSEGEETRLSLTRWLHSGQNLLELLEGTLSDYERVRAEAEMYRAERDRLRNELDRLREENERFLQERGEISQHLSRIVNDVLLPPRR